jgi:hypothetical protein
MYGIKSVFSNIFSVPATSERDNFYSEWHKQRTRAAKFGPSHVTEIDAIFSRY